MQRRPCFIDLIFFFFHITDLMFPLRIEVSVDYGAVGSFPKQFFFFFFFIKGDSRYMLYVTKNCKI